MSSDSKSEAADRRAGRPGVADRRGPRGGLVVEPRPSVALVVVVGWLVPGAAHAWLGRLQKGVVFFAVLVGMFAMGIAYGGRLFPLQAGDLLVLLAGMAEWALGVPRLVAAIGGLGRGDVVAASYEYGNTFLIGAGLLNTLVVLDAVDLATGRKS